MRRKRTAQGPVPLKFIRYRPEDWPDGGAGAWIKAREKWNAIQPVDLRTRCGPLGDQTALLKARREARLADYGASR